MSATDATYAFTEVRLGLTPAAMAVGAAPDDRSLGGADLPHRRGVRRPRGGADGLVTKAVPEADFNAEVDEICGALAKGNPQGLRETKALLGRPLVERIDAQGGDLAKLSARLFGSEEAKNAMLAFLLRKKG